MLFKGYRFPLKHNVDVENRKKKKPERLEYHSWLSSLQATIKASNLFHPSQKTNRLFMDEFPQRIITMETPQRWRHCCFLWLLSPQKTTIKGICINLYNVRFKSQSVRGFGRIRGADYWPRLTLNVPHWSDLFSFPELHLVTIQYGQEEGPTGFQGNSLNRRTRMLLLRALYKMYCCPSSRSEILTCNRRHVCSHCSKAVLKLPRGPRSF